MGQFRDDYTPSELMEHRGVIREELDAYVNSEPGNNDPIYMDIDLRVLLTLLDQLLTAYDVLEKDCMFEVGHYFTAVAVKDYCRICGGMPIEHVLRRLHGTTA